METWWGNLTLLLPLLAACPSLVSTPCIILSPSGFLWWHRKLLPVLHIWIPVQMVSQLAVELSGNSNTWTSNAFQSTSSAQQSSLSSSIPSPPWSCVASKLSSTSTLPTPQSTGELHLGTRGDGKHTLPARGIEADSPSAGVANFWQQMFWTTTPRIA